MSDFRLWLHDHIARLDDARARKHMVYAMMAFFVALSLGPYALHAATALASRIVPPAHITDNLPQTQVVTIMEAAPTDADVPLVADENKNPVPPPPAAPPLAVALLTPHSGAEITGPVNIAARVKGAKAIGVIFEVVDANDVAHVTPAAYEPVNDQWTATFTGDPGEYRLNIRASDELGAVSNLKDQGAFRVLAAPAPHETVPNPDAPAVDLFSPADNTAVFENTAPLTARIRNGLPDEVVFIVTGTDGAETIVVARLTTVGDYWTALFEGPTGAYRIKARATIRGEDLFSPERSFILKR